MKVLLINTPSQKQPVVRDMAGGLGFEGGEAVVLPPLDLAYMAATLLNKGHSVKIIDSEVEDYPEQEFYRLIREYCPNSIIANVSLPTLDNDCAFLRKCRDYSGGSLIIAKTGIAYPSLLKEILEKSQADICIYGECDLSIEEIIEGKEKKGTACLNNGILTVAENSIVQDLDALPFPARNLLSNEKYRYALLGSGVATMQTSRGCPFRCSYYCPYPLVQGGAWRRQSPEHIVREVEDIVKNHTINKILFRDAVFTLDKERIMKTCTQLVERKIKVSWWCETRIDCLDYELMRNMKEAGCAGMSVGVETGDPELMRAQAKIGLSVERVKAFRREAKEAGLKLHFLLMIGLPGETRQSILNTFKLVCDVKPDSIGVCIVTPYPGTPLYEEARRNNWIETEDWSKFDGHSAVMHTDYFSSHEIAFAQHMMMRIFYSQYQGSLKGRLKARYLSWRFKRWLLPKG